MNLSKNFSLYELVYSDMARRKEMNNEPKKVCCPLNSMNLLNGE
jgi:hypothetical protein